MGALALVALLAAAPFGGEPAAAGPQRLRLAGNCVGTPTLMAYAAPAERPAARPAPREAARERRLPTRCYRLAGWPE